MKKLCNFCQEIKVCDQYQFAAGACDDCHILQAMTDCPTPEWEDHSVLFQQCRARYQARVEAEEREVRLRAARLRAVGLTERDYQIEKDFLG